MRILILLEIWDKEVLDNKINVFKIFMKVTKILYKGILPKIVIQDLKIMDRIIKFIKEIRIICKIKLIIIVIISRCIKRHK